jgi:hypothetical protein
MLAEGLDLRDVEHSAEEHVEVLGVKHVAVPPRMQAVDVVVVLATKPDEKRIRGGKIAEGREGLGDRRFGFDRGHVNHQNFAMKWKITYRIPPTMQSQSRMSVQPTKKYSLSAVI